MVQMMTISEGIDFYKSSVDFKGKTNTRKAYFRALTLFQEFLGDSILDRPLKYRNISINSLITDIPETIIDDFTYWIISSNYIENYRGRKGRILIPQQMELAFPSTKSKKYSIATIKLYVVAINRLLKFWHQHNLLMHEIVSSQKFEDFYSIRTHLQPSDAQETNVLTVPDNFGPLMINAAEQWVTKINLKSEPTRCEKLESLRGRAVISVILNTGLRPSDLIRLEIQTVYKAKMNNGFIEIPTIINGKKAICNFTEDVLTNIESYIMERNDHSPWLFIQHGKSGAENTHNIDKYLINEGKGKSYGMRLTPLSIWRIIQKIAALAGFEQNEKSKNTTAKALRFEFIKSLLEKEMPIQMVQSALGVTSGQIALLLYGNKQIDIEKYIEYSKKNLN